MCEINTTSGCRTVVENQLTILPQIDKERDRRDLLSSASGNRNLISCAIAVIPSNRSGGRSINTTSTSGCRTVAENRKTILPKTDEERHRRDLLLSSGNRKIILSCAIAIIHIAYSQKDFMHRLLVVNERRKMAGKIPKLETGVDSTKDTCCKNPATKSIHLHRNSVKDTCRKLKGVAKKHLMPRAAKSYEDTGHHDSPGTINCWDQTPALLQSVST